MAGLFIVALFLTAQSVFALEVHYPQWRVDSNPRHVTFRVDTPVKFEALKRHARSQTAEDDHLYNKYFCGVNNGTFLELGALDGMYLSNTHLFEFGLGWRGVLIEGNPISFERLKVNRPNSIRIHAAVCETYRSVRYVVNGTKGPAVTGILEFMSDAWKDDWHPNWRNYTEKEAPTIPCYPMDALLRSAGLRHYHFMSLDVEGAELSVLQSMDFQAVTFNVMVVESPGQGPRVEKVRNFLQEKGYQLVENWERSDWYVRHGWEPTPCKDSTWFGS